MVDVSPFQAEFGTRQGRISPLGVVPPEGSFVYTLGYDLPLHSAILSINDYIQITQSATFTAGTKLFRMRVRMRSPIQIPQGLKWILTLSIDGVERTRRTLVANALRDLFDLAANVTNLGGGAHAVALRLQLVTG
jgi:hypothetical protein